MNFRLLLILALLILNFVTYLRFRKTKFNYFFFVVSLIDPLHIIVNSIFHFNNAVIYFSYVSFCYFVVFPLFENKIKIILLLSTAVSLLYYSAHPLLTMMNVIIIQSAMIIFLFSSVRLTIQTKDKIEIFKLVLIASLLLNIIRAYFYYNELNMFMLYFDKITAADFLITALITLAGPAYYKIKIPSADRFKTSKQDLNPTEIQIIGLITKGFTSHEIADKLFVSKKTVDFYRSSIKTKLNVSKKSDLVTYYNTNIYQNYETEN